MRPYRQPRTRITNACAHIHFYKSRARSDSYTFYNTIFILKMWCAQRSVEPIAKCFRVESCVFYLFWTLFFLWRLLVALWDATWMATTKWVFGFFSFLFFFGIWTMADGPLMMKGFYWKTHKDYRSNYSSIWPRDGWVIKGWHRRWEQHGRNNIKIECNQRTSIWDAIILDRESLQPK